MTNRNLKHPSIKAFAQHGFIAEKWIDGSEHSQIVGCCIFCGKDNHFYINVDTKQWDCKVCGQAGGFQTFLKKVVAKGKKDILGYNMLTLAKSRGVKSKTIRDRDIGYNNRTRSYILPVYSLGKEKLWDIRIFKNGKTISTAGCSIGLYGIDWFNDDFTTIWLCEGEWDGLCMIEAIRQAKNKTKHIALAVPGSGVFKDEWVSLFKGKKVNVLYDNDFGGQGGISPTGDFVRTGAIKVYDRLKGIAKELNFIHWQEKHALNYDIRDLYRDNRKSIFKSLRALFSPIPAKLSEGDKEKEEKKKKLSKGKGVHIQTVYKKFKKWLKFPSNNVSVLDVMYGTVIANRLGGDPIWMFLVAPSGGMKSELLMTLAECNDILMATQFTRHTLISGMNIGGGIDPSLIPKLDGKVLVIKDFTTILDMNPTERDEVFGILRAAYDGKIEKMFGNGVIRNYESSFGILAGVTPVIELYTEGHTALGERFLRFRIPELTSRTAEDEMLIKAMGNIGREGEMRDELNQISEKTLTHDFGKIPNISPDLVWKVMKLAQWTAVLRSSISRDRYTKQVNYRPFTEKPTRLMKQFTKLLFGIAMFKRLKEVTDVEYSVLKNIARTSAPSRLEIIVRFMYTKNKKGDFTSQEIINASKLPPETCRLIIQNLEMIGALVKTMSGSYKEAWCLSNQMIELMTISEIYKHHKREAL